MIVCICHNISDKVIIAQAKRGASFEELQFDLGLSTNCGRCEEMARGIVDKCHAEMPTQGVFPQNTSTAIEVKTTPCAQRTWHPVVVYRHQPAST